MTAYAARFGLDPSYMRRPKGHFALSVRSLCRIQLIIYGRHSDMLKFSVKIETSLQCVYKGRRPLISKVAKLLS